MPAIIEMNHWHLITNRDQHYFWMVWWSLVDLTICLKPLADRSVWVVSTTTSASTAAQRLSLHIPLTPRQKTITLSKARMRPSECLLSNGRSSIQWGDAASKYEANWAGNVTSVRNIQRKRHVDEPQNCTAVWGGRVQVGSPHPAPAPSDRSNQPRSMRVREIVGYRKEGVSRPSTSREANDTVEKFARAGLISQGKPS
jgi:hypothetical protein